LETIAILRGYLKTERFESKENIRTRLFGVKRRKEGKKNKKQSYEACDAL